MVTCSPNACDLERPTVHVHCSSTRHKLKRAVTSKYSGSSMITQVTKPLASCSASCEASRRCIVTRCRNFVSAEIVPVSSSAKFRRPAFQAPSCTLAASYENGLADWLDNFFCCSTLSPQAAQGGLGFVRIGIALVPEGTPQEPWPARFPCLLAQTSKHAHAQRVFLLTPIHHDHSGGT